LLRSTAAAMQQSSTPNLTMFSSRHAQPPPAYPAHYQNRI
jgi:hypothetical protein